MDSVGRVRRSLHCRLQILVSPSSLVQKPHAFVIFRDRQQYLPALQVHQWHKGFTYPYFVIPGLFGVYSPWNWWNRALLRVGTELPFVFQPPLDAVELAKNVSAFRPTCDPMTAPRSRYPDRRRPQERCVVSHTRWSSWDSASPQIRPCVSSN